MIFCPISNISYPFLYSCSDSLCTFETNGHVASTKDNFFNLASSGTDFGTPWAEKITGLLESSISDNSSTKIAPLFLILQQLACYVQFHDEHILVHRTLLIDFSTISIALFTPAQKPLGEANKF